MADGKNLAIKVAALASSGIKPELIRKAIDKASEEEAKAKTKFFGEKTKRIYHKCFNKLSAHKHGEWIHIKAWDYKSSRKFSQTYILSYNVKTGEIKYDTTDPRVDKSLIEQATDFLKELLGEKETKKSKKSKVVKAEDDVVAKQYPRVQKLLQMLHGAKIEPEFSDEKSTTYTKGDSRVIVFYNHKDREAYVLVNSEEYPLSPSEARELYKNLVDKRWR